MTAGENRAEIEAELARRPVPHLQFVYVELPAWVRRLQWNKEVSQFTYYLWQLAGLRHARRLHCEVGLDVVHHITLSKYWMPTFLYRLPVPLIWGPVGGGESAPLPFWKDFSFRGKVYEVLRSLARWLGERDPFLKRAARRSALVLATSLESEERMRRLCPPRMETYPAIGLTAGDLGQLRALEPRDAPAPRFVSIGRLLHWKGFHLGIEAFAKAGLRDADYWVIGDGPELPRLRALAKRLEVCDRVRFLGRLPRERTLRCLADCDVLVHPSLHESGGLTCLEAMAARRPVICLDLGGPALQVSDDVGIRVAAGDPARAMEGLAAAMSRLARDRGLRQRMGEAGLRRVDHSYTWAGKVDFYIARYHELARQGRAARGQRPAENPGRPTAKTAQEALGSTRAE